MNSNFTPITEEQRQQAKLSRLADQKYATEHLKTEYTDQQHWQTLASKCLCKLPGWWYPITDIKYMRRVAKKAGVDIKDYVESTGFSNIKEFAQANSNYTAVAGVGLLLEWIDEQTPQILINNTQVKGFYRV